MEPSPCLPPLTSTDAPPSGASRRAVLGGATAAATGLLTALPSPAHARTDGRGPGADPFTLGVASGDPLPTAVVIWTRLAPSPYEVGGGMRDRAYPVQWMVATDPHFRRVVRRGTTFAHPELSHSVHVDVTGLQPGREYWYRFRSGRHLSPAGRTLTSPDPRRRTRHLDLVVASCQSIGAGWYHAWKDAVRQPADLVYFAGDYIYEYQVDASSTRWPYVPALPDDYSRRTDTLDRFRQQYSLYKSDPDLQEAHRLSPWMVVWDDHEVVNDYDAHDPMLFQLRANGYRAFWEHMPLRRPQMPTRHHARLHRRLGWGDLASFHVVGTRQFRSPELPGGAIGDIPERRDPSRTMLGRSQERWLLDGLGSTGARWEVMANSILFSRLDSDDTAGERFSAGQWDGYQASQQRVIDTVRRKGVDGFVVLTGDIHRNYHLDVLADFEDPSSRVVGVEFAGTSISSGRDGRETDAGLEVRKRANPHMEVANLWRGYLRCSVTPEHWTTELRCLDRITTQEHRVWTSDTLRTHHGRPGLVRV